MKKLCFFVFVVLIFSMLFSVSLSAPQPKNGGTIKIALSGQVPPLDPVTADDTMSRQILHSVLEGLIVQNENYEVIPMLAKSWDISDDGKVCTFYLREGVQFQKGYGEMTAEDVIASINRAKKYSTNKNGLDQIKELNAKDKYTVIIKLEGNPSVLLNRLAVEKAPIAIMPMEVIEDVPARELTDDQIIGTGPYQLAEWKRDQYLLLERFEDYTPFEGMPMSGRGGHKIAYADQLKFTAITEMGARLAGLKTGQFDFVQSLGPDMYEQIASDPNLEPELVKSGRFVVTIFNTVNGPMADLNLRRAIQVGMDCREILEGVQGDENLYELNGSIYRTFQPWYTEAGLEYYNENNLEKAKKLIEKYGYKGREITIATTKDLAFVYDASIVLYSQLGKMGLNPQLKIYDWPTLLDKFFKDWTGWDLTFTGISSVRDDPLNYYTQFNGTWSYKSEKMEEIFKKLRETTDHEKRLKLNEEFQEFVMTDIPLYNTGLIYFLDGRSSSLKGYKAYGNMIRFWNVWKE